MLNPVALIAARLVPYVPSIPDLAVLPAGESWALLTLSLDAADAERYSRIAEQDAKWLSWALARQHNAVAQICGTIAAYPLQFGMVVPTVDELIEAADRHREQLHGYFELVAGAAEWGLKASINEDSDDAELAQSAQSGLAWLKAKQSAPERRRQRLDAAAQKIEAVLESLSAQARARADVRRQNLIPGQQQPLANAAMLIDLSRVEGFLRDVDLAVATLASEGIALSLSGPWPPYSFRPRLSE